MAPRAWILCLEVKNHILTKQDLGMRKKKMRNHPKSLKIKFLYASIVLRRDTLLKYVFPKEKQKDRK